MSELLKDNIKAIIFDFDDTLIGTRAPIWQLFQSVAKTFYDIELDDETLKKYWGQPIDVLARNYCQTEDTATAIEHVYQMAPNFPKQIYDSTVPTLNRLKQASKLIGIVSATYSDIIKEDMDYAKIPLNLVDYLQTSEDTTFHKPNPAVFNPMLTWANSRHIDPSDIVYIGDGLQDMTASTEAGLNFIGITTGIVSKEDFSSHGHKSIADLSELLS